jgi:N-carbamoyl-L-amino-acid hydrolase
MPADIQINPTRLLNDLADLAAIGATPEGGVARPALSQADLAARDWLRGRAEQAGLEVHQDGMANLSMLLKSESASKVILLGSHLDSVPNGGCFDGSLGVVAALEAARTIQEAGLKLPYHIEVMNFTDEEGRWSGLMGSRALAGNLRDIDFEHPRGGKDLLDQALREAGISRESAISARRDPASLRAWLEVHIEQGVRLEEAGNQVGIVTEIVGIASYWLTFVGRADHAGTTPLDRRADALRGVAEFIRQLDELVPNRFKRGVMNCGNVVVTPGAFNIVPERARLALEFRHPELHRMEAMREAIMNLALHVVEIVGLGMEVEQVGWEEPSPMHREIHGALEYACDSLELRHMHLPSYAGHDTQVMARICPAGMFFVPSVNGASHSPRELTSDEDCINAANVLLRAALKIAES